MVYAEFGGQRECIMGNSKIENWPLKTHLIGEWVRAVGAMISGIVLMDKRKNNSVGEIRCAKVSI